MIGTTPALYALGGGPVRLVGQGVLSPQVAFSRASTAFATGADGTAWQAAGVDAPRLSGAARRLLMEGQRTNLIQNPGNAGAAAGPLGSGGALPTGWGISTGINYEIAPVTRWGLPGVDIRFVGTPNTANARALSPGSFTTGTAGAQHAFSALVALVAGALPASLSSFVFRNGSETDIGVTFLPGAAPQRLSFTKTLPSTTVGPQFRWTFTNTTTAVDFTLFVSAWQVEAGGFVSTPVFPPAGTSAASTRAADLASLALGTARAARGTLAGTFLLPQAAPAGIELGLLQLDDGSEGNRIAFRIGAGGVTAGVQVVSGGSTAATLAGTAVTPGTAFRAALAWDPGGVALCLGGGAVQSYAGAPPPGLARLLIGRAAFGEIGPLDLHASRLPDSGLQALTTA
ncbi:hypothetical protein [Roseomonas indoligenes]|uniref:Uncharacterized protein n=1 Tax=Roseomonas indoligenes TaxID=2820811 RepID=A0A940MVP6_9PROT|nr:hypothetical protein [Pararoseomonas indoligenes]MBP0491835.1 hypothetical protein [Pararoseomonas indoligenes]